MIDVSILRGPCPRCPGRRVWRVSVPTDEWSCIPNAMPFPYERSHVKDHDATEELILQPQETQVNTMKNTKTQRPCGAGNGR